MELHAIRSVVRSFRDNVKEKQKTVYLIPIIMYNKLYFISKISTGHSIDRIYKYNNKSIIIIRKDKGESYYERC